MNRLNRFLVGSCPGAVFFVGAATADTLELKDGPDFEREVPRGTQAVAAFRAKRRSSDFQHTENRGAGTFTANPGHSRSRRAPASRPPENSCDGRPTAGVAELTFRRARDPIPAGQFCWCA